MPERDNVWYSTTPSVSTTAPYIEPDWERAERQAIEAREQRERDYQEVLRREREQFEERQRQIAEARADTQVIVSAQRYRTPGLRWLTGEYLERDSGYYGRDTRYVVVSRREAEANDCPFYESADDLPPIIRCGVCGQETDEIVSDGRCRRCEVRAEQTISAIERGGRRFGIELEFNLPGDAYDYDYDDDDPDGGEYYRGYGRYDRGGPGYSGVENGTGEECNCGDCRRDRDPDYSPSRDMSPTAIAAAITRAGTPCIAPGYNHEVYENEWKIVPDGSVSHGFELVSPPLQWATAHVQLRQAIEALTAMGCHASTQCGLHVHHDVGDLTARSAARLARNWTACQETTNLLVAPYRLQSQWCYPGDTARQCAYEGPSLHGFLELDYERYRPLNWTCWANYGTVEVRMHESTMDADEILAWVAYTQSIIEASMEGRELTTPDTLEDALQQLRIRRAARPTRTRELLRQKAVRIGGEVRRPARRRRGMNLNFIQTDPTL